jgi:hypothetical protein
MARDCIQVPRYCLPSRTVRIRILVATRFFENHPRLQPWVFVRQNPKVPSGTKEPFCRPSWTFHFCATFYPALKGWAIIGARLCEPQHFPEIRWGERTREPARQQPRPTATSRRPAPLSQRLRRDIFVETNRIDSQAPSGATSSCPSAAMPLLRSFVGRVISILQICRAYGA